jgi:hypothetical protein
MKILEIRMRNLIFVFVGMAFSYLSATGDLSEGAPEGEVTLPAPKNGVKLIKTL